jgi:hypothetical protein
MPRKGEQATRHLAQREPRRCATGRTSFFAEPDQPRLAQTVDTRTRPPKAENPGPDLPFPDTVAFEQDSGGLDDPAMNEVRDPSARTTAPH